MKNKIIYFKSRFLILWLLPVFFVCAIFLYFIGTKPSQSEISLVGKLNTETSIEAIAEKFRLSNMDQVFPFSENTELSNIYRFNFSGSQSDFDRLLGAREFDYVEEDDELQINTVTVNDPGFTSTLIDQEKQWWLSLVKVPDAWEIEKGSEKVNVAVIDTGINGQHEDLSDGRVGAGYLSYCQISDPSNGTCLIHVEGTSVGSVNTDDNGHGTIVAGIIGAATDNSKGVAGIAQKVRLIPVKVMDSAGEGVSSDVAA